MKTRPQHSPNVWVRVEHTQRTIQFFLNNGQPFIGSGSYMSLSYFNVYRESMGIHGYTYTNKLSELLEEEGWNSDLI